MLLATKGQRPNRQTDRDPEAVRVARIAGIGTAGGSLPRRGKIPAIHCSTTNSKNERSTGNEKDTEAS